MDTLQGLRHAVTAYDRRQARGKYYNVYALGQYLARLDDCAERVAAGLDWRAAIVGGFNDRLRDTLLRALGQENTSDHELDAANQSSARLLRRG